MLTKKQIAALKGFMDSRNADWHWCRSKRSGPDLLGNDVSRHQNHCLYLRPKDKKPGERPPFFGPKSAEMLLDKHQDDLDVPENTWEERDHTDAEIADAFGI